MNNFLSRETTFLEGIVFFLFLGLVAAWFDYSSKFPTMHDNGAADGYYFESQSFNKRSIKIKTEYYNNVKELREKAAALGLQNPNDILAFSHSGRNLPVCTIHIIDPSIYYDPTILGHEVVHCLMGDFHPSQG